MNKIPVIYYHSIAPAKNPDWVRKFLTLETVFFEDQLKFLKRNGFTTVFMNDYVAHKKGQISLPKNTACITFDDGYVDNWIYAFPLLKKYGLRGTIFINPEFVDEKSGVRPTLEDYWNGKASLEEINNWGYLTWEEMRLMEQSGVIDIQSHTLTHTKYFVSDKITGFHHPGSDCLYPLGNMQPERKPYYIEDADFEKIAPYGYPFFEEKSAIIARKVTINPDFINETVDRLRNYDWGKVYDKNEILNLVSEFYQNAKEHNKIISGIETEDEYQDRVRQELRLSKKILEEKLDKSITICCWPHGDYNDFSVSTAREEGYTASTIVVKPGLVSPPDRFERIGLYHVRNSKLLTSLKTIYKIRSFQERFPYKNLRNIYYRLKY